VRLSNIDYRDADGRPIVSRTGFFIEELSDVAKRNGLKETHAPDRIPATDLSPPDAARYALFQEMIANHDWSMRAGPAGRDCCHNAELIGALGPGMTIPIPYDFDFSGYVSPPYATPPDELHISSVRQRFYRGYCIDNSDVTTTAKQFRDAQSQLVAAVTATPGLEPGTQSRAIGFLNGFFAEIATDDAVSAKLLKHCIN
jgi:hypothetical protein